jgi:L-asparagine oxygenase
MLKQFRLTDDDRVAVRELLVEVVRDPRNLDETSFLERSTLLAQELPIRIRETFYEFKLYESAACLLISNNPVSPQDIGSTPRRHWQFSENRPLNLPQIMHGLYSSLLGEPFGFESQQNGRIFNDLIPIPNQQTNSSSGGGCIGLHTEDSFQPFMPDYLGLLCLRNEEKAVTTFSSLWQTEIPETARRVLFEKRFLAQRKLTSASVRASEVQQRKAILFGDPQKPYLRYGSIEYDKCDSETKSALRFLMHALEENQQTITLSQGECLYLDNFVAVHGRAAYQPLYGPEGRWFCRLVMNRDLRRTRAFRASSNGRIMLTDTY